MPFSSPFSRSGGNPCDARRAFVSANNARDCASIADVSRPAPATGAGGGGTGVDVGSGGGVDVGSGGGASGGAVGATGAAGAAGGAASACRGRGVAVGDAGTRVAVGRIAVAVGVADAVAVAVGCAAGTAVRSASAICRASSPESRGACRSVPVTSDGTSSGASAERAPLLDVPPAAVVATTANDQIATHPAIAAARTAQPSTPCSRCQNVVGPCAPLLAPLPAPLRAPPPAIQTPPRQRFP